MIAYNNAWLDNLVVREAASDAFEQKLLSKEERSAIDTKYPVGFYTPNIFIRIGLFLLTTVILIFSFGLLCLVILGVIEEAIGVLAIVFGLLSFGALQYMVGVKHHYRSGVDDALLWMTALAFFGGMGFFTDFGELQNYVLAFMITAFLATRFTDRLMTIIAFGAFLGILFYVCTHAGNWGKAIVPFVIMAVSAVVFVAAKSLQKKNDFRYHDQCLEWIAIAALILFYLAGNYYIVRELTISMFGLMLQPGQTIPFGWLFWIFTLVIPPVYLLWGIRKKDKSLIRIALLLLTVLVFTIRYYYSVVALEIIMTLGGIALISIAWILIRFLKESKYGFTYQEIGRKDQLTTQIESLIIAETFTAQPAGNDTRFGGGDFGGGGASGEF